MAAVRRERTRLCAPPESLLQEEPTRIKPPRDLWGAPAGRAHGGPGSWGAGRPRLVLPLFTAGSRGSAGDSAFRGESGSRGSACGACGAGWRSLGRAGWDPGHGAHPARRCSGAGGFLLSPHLSPSPCGRPADGGRGGQLTAAAAQARSPFRVPFATYALTWRLALLASGSYRRQRAAVFCRV